MTPSDAVTLCASNNALWCDAVLRAAGASTSFQHEYWIARDVQLPLYPSVVTTTRTSTPELYATLEELPSKAAVKDSFDRLDLGNRGFERIFKGTWLFRAPQTIKKPPAASDWHKVATQDAMSKWLAAWNANANLQRVFSPSLLQEPSVEFATIANGTPPTTGCVFNHGPKRNGSNVVGLSNIFHPKNWLFGALNSLLAPYPHRPICTYETDADHLPIYRQLGFTECGSLSVWVKA